MPTTPRETIYIMETSMEQPQNRRYIRVAGIIIPDRNGIERLYVPDPITGALTPTTQNIPENQNRRQGRTITP